jgi:hypothetical protein
VLTVTRHQALATGCGFISAIRAPQRFAGGPTPNGEDWAPNIKPAGFGFWSKDNIACRRRIFQAFRRRPVPGWRLCRRRHCRRHPQHPPCSLPRPRSPRGRRTRTLKRCRRNDLPSWLPAPVGASSCVSPRECARPMGTMSTNGGKIPAGSRRLGRAGHRDDWSITFDRLRGLSLLPL